MVMDQNASDLSTAGQDWRPQEGYEGGDDDGSSANPRHPPSPSLKLSEKEGGGSVEKGPLTQDEEGESKCSSDISAFSSTQLLDSVSLNCHNNVETSKHRSEVFVSGPDTPQDFFIWNPSPSLEVTPGTWYCPICPDTTKSEEELKVHIYQFHINPRFLSQDDRKHFHLSNFHENYHEDKELGSTFPGLYRCHECFNTFTDSLNLSSHLVKHSREDKGSSLKTQKMAPRSDHFSREDFEDASPRLRRKATSNRKSKERAIKSLSRQCLTNNQNSELKMGVQSRPRRQVTQRRTLDSESEISDDFNSNSENEGDLSNRKQGSRPQRECKLRTKTLLAISLAEQDYDKFDLDFGKFKTDVSGSPEVYSTNPSSVDQKLVKNGKEIENGLDEIVPTKLEKTSKSNESHKKKKTVTKIKGNSKKKVSKKKGRRKLPTSQKLEIRDNSLSAPKKPVKNRTSSFSLKDHRKASKLVTDMMSFVGDFICLTCKTKFPTYDRLKSHTRICGPRTASIFSPTTDITGIETSETVNTELSEYVTGAAVKVPETSFNYLHGKIGDLLTHDAKEYQSKVQNALGLVRLNYSGQWNVKDVWEVAGWEPKHNQLTWQQYELAAAIQAVSRERVETVKREVDVKQEMLVDTESPENISESLHTDKAVLNGDLNGGKGEITTEHGVEGEEDEQKFYSCSKKSTPFSSSDAASVTKDLTMHVLNRQAPLLTGKYIDRAFLIKLSKLSWPDQRKVKESFDQILTSKKGKKVEKIYETNSRHQSLPVKLELKQVGRSVKYMKAHERNAVASSSLTDLVTTTAEPVGILSGEWEIEHSFVCSVCGVEYDDVLEIMHHKWEAHPHCLVAHVSLKESTERPPALLYPQVGPSTVQLDPSAATTPPQSLTCSKCQEEFIEKTDFHSHILICGGLKPWEISTSKKKKRRGGYGGGLRSTIRMLKKSLPSRDGTDTEESSPKKKVRAPPRVFTEAPLIPTHNRTTRFKESRVKEAKNLAARERKKERRAKLREQEGKGSGNNKQEGAVNKKDPESIVIKKVLREIVETVHTREKRISRRDSVGASSKEGESASNGIKSKRLSKRMSQRRRNVHVYKEASSEDSSDERQSELISTSEETDDESPSQDPSKSYMISKTENGVPQEVIATVNHLIDAVILAHKTVVDSKLVKVQIVPDEQSYLISDLSRLNIIQDTKTDTPAKRSGKKRSRSSSLEGKIENNSVGMENGSPYSHREGSGKTSASKVRLLPSRTPLPVHIQLSVIDRIDEGEIQADIAKEMNLSVSAITSLWLRRESIRCQNVRFDKDNIGSGAIKSNCSNIVDRVKRKLSLCTDDEQVWKKSQKGLDSETNYETPKVESENDLPQSSVHNRSSGSGSYEIQTKLSETAPETKIGEIDADIDNNITVVKGVRSPKEKNCLGKAVLCSSPNEPNDTFVSSNGLVSEVHEISIPDSLLECCNSQKRRRKSMAENINSDQKDNLSIDSNEIINPPQVQSASEIESASAIRTRRSSLTSTSNSHSLGSRLLMPLEVKQEALRKIINGETQANVARDLDIPVSTVSTWWRRKDSILSADNSSTVDFLDQSVDELVKIEQEGLNGGLDSVTSVKGDDQMRLDRKETEIKKVHSVQDKKSLLKKVRLSKLHAKKKALKKKMSRREKRMKRERREKAMSSKSIDNTVDVDALDQKESVIFPSEETNSESAELEECVAITEAKSLKIDSVKSELLKSMKNAFNGGSSDENGEHNGDDGEPPSKKKKTLEFFTNNLLEKALVHYQHTVDVIVTDSENPSIKAEATNGFCKKTSPGKPVTDVSVSQASLSTDSFGLCLIADSYVSSEEES